MTTTMDELTLLMANMSISTVEEPQDMIIDQNENEQATDMEVDTPEPERMGVDDESGSDMMCVDTNTGDDHEEQVDELTAQFSDMSIATTAVDPVDELANDFAKMAIWTVDDEIDELADLLAGLSIAPAVDPVEALANDLAKMEISTMDDKIDELADLFSGLSIAPPDPVDELAIEFGKMSISNVEPVWIGHDDRMELD